MGTAYGRVSGSPDVEDLRLGWRIALGAGMGGGTDHDFWLDPGAGDGGAGVGAGFSWKKERTGARTSAGVDLAASETGDAEVGIRLAWDW